MNNVQMILGALSQLRIGPQPEEYEIHREISRVLEDAGIPFEHERKLLPGRRIDFACGSIGIEVKKGHPDRSRLCAQLKRYLEETDLTAMIVVMQKPCSLPDTICGKNIHVVALNRLWGVALH